MTENEKGEVWQRTEIESPCRKVCVIHPLSQLCIGCYRTAEEIRLWSSYSKEFRKALLVELPQRSDFAIPKKRRGRRNRVRSGSSKN